MKPAIDMKEAIATVLNDARMASWRAGYRELANDLECTLELAQITANERTGRIPLFSANELRLLIDTLKIRASA